MTDDERALRNMILANPDDDAPRLILADWYDEHQEGPRAEFIRQQIELARLTEESDPRRWDLEKSTERILKRHQRKWLKPYGVFANQVQFRRGFITRLTEDEEQKTKRLEDLFTLEPITEIEPRSASFVEKFLFNHPRSAYVTHLDCSSMTMTAEDVERLLTFNGWQRLTTLNVGWSMVPEMSLIKLFRTTLKSVNDMDFCGAEGLTQTRRQEFFTVLTRFKKVSLGYTDLGDGGLLELASRRFPHLEYLDIGAEQIHTPGLLAFLGAARMPKLQTLRIFANPIHNAAAEALATNNPWPKLEELDVGNCHFGTKAARAFARSTAMQNLRRLHLGNELDNYPNRIGDLGLRALANSSHLPALRELDVLYNGITAKGVGYLCASPMIGQLWKLNLNNNEIGDEGAITLARCPAIASLRMVGLLGCGLTDRGARALLNSPYWSKHIRINVDDNDISEGLLKSCGRRFATVPTNRFARSFAAPS